MAEHALVLITCGDDENARTIARSLVERRLAAGAQMLPIESVYRWQEKVVEDNEVLVLAKTRKERFVEIKTLVEELHSYEVPPVVMVEIDDASAPYLDWIDENIEG
jgi:periplasmic divalent cation tolerance protein